MESRNQSPPKNDLTVDDADKIGEWAETMGQAFCTYVAGKIEEALEPLEQRIESLERELRRGKDN